MDVTEMLFSEHREPTLSVNFQKVVRPSSTISDPFTYKIEKPCAPICWKIADGKLLKVTDCSIGILFDSESYIIQWAFDLRSEDKLLLNKQLLYHWTGQNAKKGASPLPPGVDESCLVERVVQWSEPFLFFQSFVGSVCTFIGREEDFDENSCHLMLIRGEIAQEIHLYEVPCERRALRSRASFLLILPKEKSFIYWHGTQTSLEHRKNIVAVLQPEEVLRKWRHNWVGFGVKEVAQGVETEAFLSAVPGDECRNPPSQRKIVDFSPKLFYLNSITGTFLATEIEYSLRSANVAPFPFLQSHLYTASQPALFLLDNHTDIWLWKRQKNVINDADYTRDLASAEELAEKYVTLKSQTVDEKVSLHHVFAGEEPIGFKNVFPFWQEKSPVNSS